MTHNEFIKLFTDISTNHRDINSFGSGDLWEYMANEGATLNPVTMWVFVQPNSVVGGVDNPKYSIVIMDAVDKGEGNEDEVLSDTLRIAKDILAVLRQPYYEDFFQFDKNVTFDNFTERFDSEMSGWQFDITFKQPFTYDGCQVNMSSLPNIYTTDVVRIVDQDDNLVTTVNPGEQYSVIVASGIDEGNSTTTYTNQVVDI